MHYILLHGRKVCFFISFLWLFIFQPFITEARQVNDVTIETTDDGYEVTLHFETQVRYQSHSPRKSADFVRIEVRSVVPDRKSHTDNLEFLRDRISLSWDHNKAPSINEITYIGTIEKPLQVIFDFNEEVDFKVRSSVDLRSLIVTVKTKKSPHEKATNKTPSPN